MPSTATITSKTGPAATVTSLLLSDVREFLLQLGGKSRLQVTDNNVGIKEFDINATTTLTCTIAAGVATIVVSQ